MYGDSYFSTLTLVVTPLQTRNVKQMENDRKQTMKLSRECLAEYDYIKNSSKILIEKFNSRRRWVRDKARVNEN